MKEHFLTFFAVVFLCSCSSGLSFKAQDATVAPGLRYVLTVETVDSSRTEIRVENCDSIQGIQVDVAWTMDNGDLVASASVRNNNPKYVVKSIEGPFVDGLDFRLEEYPLLMPFGMGAMLRHSPGAPDGHTPMLRENSWKQDEATGDWYIGAGYPSRNFSMAWLSFSSEERGVAFTSHDPSDKGKEFNVYFHPSDSTFSVSVRHLFTCFNGQEYEVPEFRVHPYEGTWHVAADNYRDWFMSCHQNADRPEWLKDCSGWMLAITKQQNEEIMFDYDEFGTTLCDLAVDRGLDVIGLFGWAHGGHDRFYPDYLPDPARGGEQPLRNAVKTIHDRGLRSIIYVNGQLIDQNGTRYWADTGRFVTMMDKHGKLISETWHKYYDAPARTHGRACFSCKEWQKRMLDLAKMAHSYGADGIIYDQLATRSPVFCYAPNHGHTVPAVVVEQDRLDYIMTIKEEMAKIDPEFIIMTEGVADYELGGIDMFHGCSYDVYPPNQAAMEERFKGNTDITWFPEMLPYTFPDLLMTVRNPAPVTSRNMSNFTLVFHLKNELECRYRADVRYLEEDRIPVPEDYYNVTTKPDLSLVTSQDPIAMREYQKKLADFQTEHMDFLRRGRFVDEKCVSFSASHPCSMVKAYECDGRIAVLVWNVSTAESLSYSVSVPGKKLVEVCAPDWNSSCAGDADCSCAPVPPESIALLIFE